MSLLESLHWRYAVQQFSDQKVSRSELNTLLEATRLSASSYGLQPYKIIVIESAAIRGRLRSYSYGQDKIADSSHLIIFASHTKIGDATVDRYINQYARLTDKSHEQLDKFSAHLKSALNNKTPAQQQEWAHQQAYIALGNLLTCAAQMRIDSCPMTGFDNASYDSVLGLAEQGLMSTIICPIGYRHADDVQAKSPKVRFDHDDMIMEL